LNIQPPVSRVKVPKAADLLANQLRAQILSGEWREGALLPSERELVAQAGLSRASIREGLRILELEGLIVIRPGRGGGSAVCRPSRESLERSVSLFIRGQRVRPQDLLQTREALETIVARMAAANRNETDLASLNDLHRQLFDAQGDHPRFLKVNLAWHLAVAKASHNELLAGFINAISHEIFRFTALDVLGSEQVQADTLRAHEAIMQAINSANPDAAARRMARHLQAYIDAVRDEPLLSDVVTTPPSRPARRRA
jgi:DNA-binding FadR family transcriptional regulator